VLYHDMMILAGIVGGNVSYTVAGANSFVVPRYNTLIIEMWGGGGGGGTSFNGAASSFGGNGGDYARYTLAPGALTPGVSEYLVIGNGGLGGISSGTASLAGGFTQFGNTVGVTGGRGGNGQLTVGGAPNTYTPTNPRSGFTLTISEAGGQGGFGSGGNGGSVTYAGGGGGGMTNDFGGGTGGSSTFGGRGGNGGDFSANQPRDGSSPGGAGGATDWDSGLRAGTGGIGQIRISWR
jgi:hypothetical protein